MIKTIQLTGTEQSVDGLSGYNTIIVNRSSETVYASARPGVAAGADGVIAIDAGSREELPDTNGTVYLLGSGEVNLRGTDGSVNFSEPSQSADGGGKSGTMPVTDGIVGYFDGKSGASETAWINRIDGTALNFTGGNAIVCNGELTLHNGVYMIFHMPYTDGDFTVYTVLRTDYDSTARRHNNLMGSKYGSSTGAMRGLSSDGYSGGDYFRTFIVDMYNDGFNSCVNGVPVRSYDSYHVTTLTQNNGTMSLYIDGVRTDSEKTASRRFGDYWGLGGIANNSGGIDTISNTVMHVKFWALGNAAHTSEQILKNQRFLMKKFT